MDLVSMAVESPKGIYDSPPTTSPSPYPYGCKLCLNQEQLAALGYTDLPPAGTQVHIEAVGVVTRSCTEDPDADGDIDYVSVEIQVTAMALEEEGEGDEEDDDEKSGDRAARMYEKGKQPT